MRNPSFWLFAAILCLAVARFGGYRALLVWLLLFHRGYGCER